jgi:hypothetical protein
MGGPGAQKGSFGASATCKAGELCNVGACAAIGGLQGLCTEKAAKANSVVADAAACKGLTSQATCIAQKTAKTDDGDALACSWDLEVANGAAATCHGICSEKFATSGCASGFEYDASKAATVCTTAACSSGECCKAIDKTETTSTAEVSLKATKQMYDDIITVAGKKTILDDCTTKHSAKGLSCTDGRRGARRRLVWQRKLATYTIIITFKGKTTIINSIASQLVPFSSCDQTCVSSAVVLSSSVDSSVSVFSSLGLAFIGLVTAFSAALLH